MEINEIKKILYKEKSIAKQTAIYRDGGSKDYLTETSIGNIKFHIPIEDQRNSDGTITSFTQEMPAQLLIRWIKN